MANKFLQINLSFSLSLSFILIDDLRMEKSLIQHLSISFFSIVKIINRLDYFHKISRFIHSLFKKKKKETKFAQQFPLRSSRIAIMFSRSSSLFRIFIFSKVSSVFVIRNLESSFRRSARPTTPINNLSL